MDYSGQKYGKLTVISKAESRVKGRTYWLCECDCGNTLEVRGDSFKKGNTRSCGCLKKNIARTIAMDLSGMEFDHLTVVARVEGKNDGNQWWLCKCECGKLVDIRGAHLLRGKTTSCGCKDPVFIKKTGDEAYQARIQSITTTTKDMTGHIVGRLTVLRRSDRIAKNRHAYWICKCECGNELDVSGSHLRTGHTVSCGCLNDETRKLPHKLKRKLKE